MTGSHALYSVDSIRGIEQTALHTLPPFTLMQRAGKAVAAFALAMQTDSNKSKSILVLAGPGNNGGDALEAASLLAKNGCEVVVLLTADPEALPSDAKRAYAHAVATGTVFINLQHIDSIAQTGWTLIIDGLFGIGLKRPVDGDIRQLIAAINILHVPVLAIDVPSGLNADTGTVIGDASGIAIRATHTLTFIGDKSGLHTCDGRDHAGEVSVDALDIPDESFVSSAMALSTIAMFSHALRARQHNSHKGSYGDVVVLGGAQGMSGAVILSARAAAKCGAGRVFIASIAGDLTYDSLQPELMCHVATEIDFSGRTIVAGPGMSTSRDAHDLLVKAMVADTPLILDADALNLVAEEAALQQKILSHRASILMTPHPLEAARLLGITTAQVQSDRIAAARKLATTFNAMIVLKGSGSVIAAPDGNIAINPTGNPALATAGSGDVLSGVCGALLAQQWPAWEAALAAVWLHGAAADQLVARGIGPVGLTAGELIPEIRLLLNRLINTCAIRSRQA
jgi:hydroxyethylthiazole kinase-like uncharacterized protein yjeF